MKKGKIVSMPSSLDAQIRTRARNLQIDRCYVNHNWEETQMANVIITRRHVNGNITFGIFLVDLFLLGVKDCFYMFNTSHSELEERLDNDESVKFIECDYALAHNIVYEGIAFAKEYGFDPVKDFTKTGRYILEEDTDDIPEIYIPLGMDGVPTVFVAPGENKQREINILEKTAGPGEYKVFYVGHSDWDDDDEDDDEYDEDDDYNTYSHYEDTVDEILNIGIDNYLTNYGDDLSPVEMLALTDILYYTKFGLPDKEQLDLISSLILEDDRFDPDLERLPGLAPYLDEFQSIINLMVDDEEAALSEMEALVAKHPDDPNLGFYHINLLRDLYMTNEVEQLTKYWYNRAGNHYTIRLSYAELLADQERYDEMFDLFGNLPGLDALTTEDLPFTEIMVAEFCACYALAWLSKNNISKAEPYYNIVLRSDHSTTPIKNALSFMMIKKKDALVENE